MNTYTVIRRPADGSWDSVPVLKMEYHLHPSKSGVTAQAQICYDDEALYVRLKATEKHIRAEHQGPLGEICEDSCLEFFFSPIAGDLRYFNIECNPNGALYLGMGTDIHSLVRFVPEEPSICPKTRRTDDGWVTEYAIPYRFIRLFFPDFSPAPGYTMRGNCYKCGELTPEPHCLCWNPVPLLPCASFHNPEAFGFMHFQ